MNRKNIGVLIVLLIAVCGSAYGQGSKSLCINEVMVTNIDNYQDDYGKHNPWIEIFNASYANVDIRSCYLTNNKQVLNKYLTVPERAQLMYPIPKGDVLTMIHPRQHILFWADNQPEKGNFHVNFALNPNTSNWIALYDANGTTLIDSITIPARLGADCSYALGQDGIKGLWGIRGSGDGKYVTPSTNNLTLDTNEKIDKFKRLDSSGIGMAIIAMGVVFCGLLLLFISFKVVGNIASKLSKRNAMKVHGMTDMKEAKEKSIGTESGEIFAAIAMALHEQQNDVHDIEETILTINKVKRNYSPWSSKIYTLREHPRR